MRARGIRRSGAALVALGAALVAVAGCSPSGDAFATRSDAACAKAQRSIDRLAANADASAGTPQAALRTAIDRYTIVERLVSEISEAGLPSGAEGRRLQASWIDPSRSSLTDRRADLAALSSAVDEGRDAQVPALAEQAGLAGTDGVDAAYLAQAHMPACAALFAP